MASECPRCGGLGVRVLPRPGGARAVEPCECQAEQRITKLLKRALIPPRYEHCTLDSFETKFHGAHPSLAAAHFMARRFVEEYPITTAGRGLLLVGTIGVGKTHLAVAILQTLITEKGVHGLFCDYRELLKQIGHSYNPQVAATEMDILRPAFKAEVLLLDELGAVQPNGWIWDPVALLLNTRYNERRTTIITTNFPDGPGAGPAPAGFSDSDMAELAKRAARAQTLGDRIGEAMRSRLAEMCVPINMTGQDFRQNVGRARFG